MSASLTVARDIKSLGGAAYKRKGYGLFVYSEGESRGSGLNHDLDRFPHR